MFKYLIFIYIYIYLKLNQISFFSLEIVFCEETSFSLTQNKNNFEAVIFSVMWKYHNTFISTFV